MPKKVKIFKQQTGLGFFQRKEGTIEYQLENWQKTKKPNILDIKTNLDPRTDDNLGEYILTILYEDNE